MPPADQAEPLPPTVDGTDPLPDSRVDRAGETTVGVDRFDFLAPAAEPGAIGRLGHYRVLEVAGRGGMGVVFRALDEKLHRVVALKTLAGHLAASATARKRFAREARAAAAVRHENVVAIHHVEDDGPVPYLVMEFVPGQSLQDRLNRAAPLAPAEVVRIGRQVAEGLAAAHHQGLVHRDVKPGNILLDESGRVKLTDFGLARAADDAGLTDAGVVAGTPQYMSPEQARGEAVDHRSDLFSLGTVLYAMCTGRPPFRGDSIPSVLLKVCQDTPPPVEETNPDVPRWLIELIRRLHAKAPTDRPGSAREVADLLADPPADPRPPRTMRWAWAAAGMLVLAVGLGAAGLVGRWLRPGVEAAVRATDDPPTKASPEDVERAAATERTAWEASVAGRPHAELAKAVAARLQARNPEYDGKYTTANWGTETYLFHVHDSAIADLSALRALPKLREFECDDYGRRKGNITDLSPLKGLELERLNCRYNPVTDLSPLRRMPLKFLFLDHMPVTDLSPLHGMPLECLSLIGLKVSDVSFLKDAKTLKILYLDETQVADVTALAGLKLERVGLKGSRVTDLSPLKGMPLKEITLDFRPDRDAEFLRSFPDLEQINDFPADVFWQTQGKK